MADLPGAIQAVANIVMPDDFAVSGIEKRYPATAEIERIDGCAPRVAFGLGQNVLRAEGEFLGCNNAEQPATDAQGVIGWSMFRGVFNESAAMVPL